MKHVTTTGIRKASGTTFYNLKFSLECENQEFRDDVYNMIVAALNGEKVGEPEEGERVLGFHHEEEEEGETTSGKSK